VLSSRSLLSAGTYRAGGGTHETPTHHSHRREPGHVRRVSPLPAGRLSGLRMQSVQGAARVAITGQALRPMPRGGTGGDVSCEHCPHCNGVKRAAKEKAAGAVGSDEGEGMNQWPKSFWAWWRSWCPSHMTYEQHFVTSQKKAFRAGYRAAWRAIRANPPADTSATLGNSPSNSAHGPQKTAE